MGKKVHKPISYTSPFRAAREKKNIVQNNIFQLIDQGLLLESNVLNPPCPLLHG
jgi:hypothetical protein